MPRSSPLLLVLCASVPLLAQAPGLTVASGDAGVTLYGILDAGVANVAHTLDFDANHPVTVNPTLTKAGNTSATGMFNGGIAQTRWGLKGYAGLTQGWRAVFTLEGAINVPTGVASNAAASEALNRASGPTGPSMAADSAIDGQLFSRNANFGLSHETWGTLTIGRHTALMLDAIPAFDALQGAQLFTPIGFSGLYGGGGATDASRVDSCVKYRVKAGDFTLAGLYKFGGVSGSSGAKGATELSATYEHGPFAIMVGYQALKDATAVGSPSGTINTTLLGDTAAQLATVANGTAVYQPIGTVTVTCEDTKGTMAAARYKLGPVGFCAGYQYLQYTNPSNPATDSALTSLYSFPIATAVYGGKIASAVNVTPFTVGGAAMEKDLTVTWLGVNWAVTPAFTAAVSFYHVGQNDFSNGTTAAGDKSGTTTYVSALLDYTWTRAFDFYLGYMSVKGNGGMVAGYTYDTNATLGLGARFKF